MIIALLIIQNTSSGKILGKTTFFKEEATFRYSVKINPSPLVEIIHLGDQSLLELALVSLHY